jgi:xanthine dehydrogenase YagR molybdenum-binding subunit
MIQTQLARTLGIDADRVRIISPYTGGGFGSKISLKPFHVIAAEAARRLGRPVRLFMARGEEFLVSHHRAPTRRMIRLGATADGLLKFIDEDVIGQAGPSLFFARQAAGASNGLRLHRADSVRARLRRVLTNTQAPQPFRGPTAAEDIFCFEQAIDELAHELGIDPLEFRRKNIAESDPLVSLPYSGKALAQCYDKGAEAFRWHWRSPGSQEREGWSIGQGMGACAYDATLYEPSRAGMTLRPDGTLVLRIGIAEIGCGADTIMPQIASGILGLPPSLIDVELGDTAEMPRSIDSTNHSRTTAVVGPAVKAAALLFRAAVTEAAAVLLQGGAGDQMAIGPDGLHVTCDPVRRIGWATLAKMLGPIAVEAEREVGPEGVFPAMFAAHFVEVAVHRPTGRIRVLRAVCAHDSGRIVNPLLAESQVHGGFLQGMGLAVQEARALDPRDGRQMNAAMWAYRTPSILDMPESIRLVDAGVADGANSLGVKGIGEPPLIASGAAIGNAVFNATAVRVRDYPMTPARVLTALKAST